VEKGQFLNQLASGILDSYMQKNEIGLIFHTMYKSQFKMIKDLSLKPEVIKLLDKKSG
jgi:hypothetical protein